MTTYGKEENSKDKAKGTRNWPKISNQIKWKSNQSS